MNKTIKGRIFLVGCERSGTTLLQSLLAAHSQVLSFPETQFFWQVVGQTEYRFFHLDEKSVLNWMRDFRVKLGLTAPNSNQKINQTVKNLLQEYKQEKLWEEFPDKGILIKQKAEGFVKVLDDITLDNNKEFWIEKSPGHLNYIDVIEKLIPDAKFIHLVRNGADVVSSIYDAARKYPDQHWGCMYGENLDRCITRWNLAVRCTQKYIDQSNHHLIRYNKLVENPELELQNICDFIGIKFERKMTQGNTKTVDKLVWQGKEPWKSGVKNKIVNENGKKFDRLFSEEQKKYIVNHLNSTDLERDP